VYTAKLGDFGSSTMNYSAGDPSNPKLALGGFTQLWVAPEYSGPAPFEALRAMDVFSFGLLTWTVVQNGQPILAALLSQVSAAKIAATLKEYKESPGFISMIKHAVTLPGYCGDVVMEDLTAVLESTLGTPLCRDLDLALGSLRK
jgi:hypothetical protein